MITPQARQIELTLIQERSAGTFAKVFLAEARGADDLARVVAVKVLKEQWSESSEVLARTYDEARLLARLHHRNILRVEALTELEGQPAILMEFVDGIDLKMLMERLARRGERIPPRAAYKIAQDTASALEAAYFKTPPGRTDALQVVHRDIKPSNVMISVEGEVKVLDFGTARSNYEGRMAKTGAVRFGSLKYMSPERREGDRGDHAGDIYSLGLLLLEMLRGEQMPLLPLDAIEHDKALADIVARVGPLGLPNNQWDDSLRQTLLSMCSAGPAQRLNASQVVQLLRAFAEQATGPSLDTFAATVVEPITREVYGEGQAHERLSTTRIVMALSTSTDEIASRVENAPIGPGSASASKVPTSAAPAPVARAAAPPSNPGPSNTNVRPPIASAGQGNAVMVPDEDAQRAASNRNRTLLMVAVAAAAFLFLAVGGAGAAVAVWYFKFRDPAPETPPMVEAPADAPTEAPAEAPTAPAEAPVAASVARVQVTSPTDSMLQWIKVSDADGQQVLKGSPTAEASLSAGRYTLSAKMVGREAQKTELDVGADVVLTCAADDKGNIRCSSDAGAELVLQ